MDFLSDFDEVVVLLFLVARNETFFQHLPKFTSCFLMSWICRINSSLPYTFHGWDLIRPVN